MPPAIPCNSHKKVLFESPAGNKYLEIEKKVHLKNPVTDLLRDGRRQTTETNTCRVRKVSGQVKLESGDVRGGTKIG